MTIAVVGVVVMTVAEILAELQKLGPELELVIQGAHAIQDARTAKTRVDQVNATRALDDSALDVIEKAENT